MGRESSMTRELSRTVGATDDSEACDQGVAYQSATDCLRHWLVEIDGFRDQALVLGLNQFARIIDDAQTRSHAALTAIIQHGPGGTSFVQALHEAAAAIRGECRPSAD